MVLFKFDKSYTIPFPTESGYFHINTSGNNFDGPYALAPGDTIDLQFEDAFQDNIRLIGGGVGYPVASFEYLTEVGELVLVEDFQPPSVSGIDLTTTGDILYNGINFESVSDLTDFTTSGINGPASSSGIISPGLVGTASLGLFSSVNTPVYFVSTNLTSSSGIKHGRCIFIAQHTDNSDDDQCIVFNPIAGSNGQDFVGVRLRKNLSDAHNIDIVAITSSTQSALTTASPRRFGYSLSTRTARLQYSNSTIANNNRIRWWCIDWDYKEDGTGRPFLIIDVYTLVYTNGDTIADFKQNAYPLFQVGFDLPNGWSGFNNSFQPSLIFRTNNNHSEAALVDLFYLEKFNNLNNNFGLHKFTYDQNQTQTVEINLLNQQVGNTSASSEGIYLNQTDGTNSQHKNYINTASLDYFGQDGGGFQGVKPVSNQFSPQVFNAMYLPNTENITQGVIRFLHRKYEDRQILVYFLRNGAISANDHYSIRTNNTNFGTTMNVRLYKGTSRVVSVTVSAFNHEPLWIEMRWKANTLVNTTEIETLYGSVDQALVTFDKPFSIFSKLTSVFTYTDTISPKLTGPEPIAISYEIETDRGAETNWIGVVKLND